MKMATIKKPKNKIVGKIDPAFNVIIPEHMKSNPAPRTDIYEITMFTQAYNENDAIQQLGLQNLYGEHIGVRKISNEEYNIYNQDEEVDLNGQC